MKRLLPFFVALFVGVASAKDLGQLASPGDNFLVTALHVSASPIVDGQVVVWAGKVVDVSVYRKPDGATALEWFCEQYPFKSAPNLPLAEPLVLSTEPAGHFVVTLNVPTLSVSEVEEKIVKPLKAPAWVLVRGEPVFSETRKGFKAVFLHSLAATVSDTLKVEFAK